MGTDMSWELLLEQLKIYQVLILLSSNDLFVTLDFTAGIIWLLCIEELFLYKEKMFFLQILFVGMAVPVPNVRKVSQPSTAAICAKIVQTAASPASSCVLPDIWKIFKVTCIAIS